MKRPIPDLPFQCIKNPRSDRPSQYGPELQRLLSLEAHRTAFDIIGAWPGYEKTPLQTLNGVAKAMGVESLHYKDEGFRFGLKSFKALGGAYALCLFLLGEVKRRTGADKVTPDDLAQGKYKEILSNITVTATTDGNHGRSVAWGARTFGCKCVIYIPTNVSQGREDAIASYGAEIVRVGATFDESLKHCIADAEKFDRFNISDTAYPGNMDVPRDVMQGYTVMTAEVLKQISESPTHVFIQGGCGGLASSVVGHLWETLSDKRPCFTLVEPNAAACGFESIKAGKPVVLEGDQETIMAGLAVGELSLHAWEILSAGCDFCISISDDAAVATMRLLAEAPYGDDPVVGGESGVSGLAGFLVSAQDEAFRSAIGLDEKSRVLVYGTEGDTDPVIHLDEVYRDEKIVGLSAEAVRSGRK